MDMQAIVKHQSFLNLVIFLRKVSSSKWQAKHKSKTGFYYKNFERLALHYHPDLTKDIISNFSGMVSEAVMADLSLGEYYTTAELDWLLGVLDGEMTKVTLSLLLSYSSAKE